MSDEQILGKLSEIIRQSMPETAGEPITPDTVINRDLGVDSMTFVMIVCKIEAEFGIRIPDRVWPKLSTAGEVVAEIRRLLPAG